MSQFQDLVGEMLAFWWPGETVYTNYRPSWLYGMELDFYFPDLGFAVEVNGSQHYLFVPKFQDGVGEYKDQRQRDGRKREIMKRRGEFIVVIKSFKGIYTHMRKVFPDRTFPYVPAELRDKIKKYRQRAHKNRQKSVAFKVKGKQKIGINRASADYLKKQNKKSGGKSRQLPAP